MGRATQGRNIQVLHGVAGDGSMKVSDTRDSSLQVLPSTGLGGNSVFLNLQTNFNNVNTGGELDDVSALKFVKSNDNKIILSSYLDLIQTYLKFYLLAFKPN